MSYRYVIEGDHSDKPSVYKMFFGKKYYIWKGSVSLKQSVETIARDIDRFIRKNGAPGHFLEEVVKHVIRARVLKSTVEVLFQTDNMAELIDYEGLTLKKCKEDPNCLNKVFVPYVSKAISGTQNKAITDTLKPSTVSTTTEPARSSAAGKESALKPKSKLMDALAKATSKK